MRAVGGLGLQEEQQAPELLGPPAFPAFQLDPWVLQAQQAQELLELLELELLLELMLLLLLLLLLDRLLGGWMELRQRL